jgi:hypothetical protein
VAAEGDLEGFRGLGGGGVVRWVRWSTGGCRGGWEEKAAEGWV